MEDDVTEEMPLKPATMTSRDADRRKYKEQLKLEIFFAVMTAMVCFLVFGSMAISLLRSVIPCFIFLMLLALVWLLGRLFHKSVALREKKMYRDEPKKAWDNQLGNATIKWSKKYERSTGEAVETLHYALRKAERHDFADALQDALWKTREQDLSDILLRDDQSPLLRTEKIITKAGGTLEIPNTGVGVAIPPNALPKGMDQCIIELRILPDRMEEEQQTCFSPNSSIVELLPDNLRLMCPARLTLPHCLVLKETTERKARLFVSHHKKGDPPQWEEQTHLPYHLEDTTCVIHLDSFCLVKYYINDETVLAKKIVVYAAARKLLPDDVVATIAVGYYDDLPGQGCKFLRRNSSYGISQKKTFFFIETEKCSPLQLSLCNLFPSEWQCLPDDTDPKVIRYEEIASPSQEHQFFYLFHKNKKEASYPLCVFTASQEEGQTPIHLAAYPQATRNDPFNTSVVNMGSPQRQALLKTEAKISQDGGTLQIPNTSIVLEIPPGALPMNRGKCSIQMRIIPIRKAQDEVTSFSSNSSVAIELLPDNMQLKFPAKLKLPHCLELQAKAKYSARVFTKNYSEEIQTHWKEQGNFQYKLGDSDCTIWIDRFCCIKYSINDEIVIGKNIVLYAATRTDIEMKGFADVEIGYYPDMPGGGELLQLNPNLAMDFNNILCFKEKQRRPLHLSLDRIVPPGWNCCFPEQHLQEIPYKMIAWSVEHSYLYIIQKTDKKAGNPVCKFTATQEKGDRTVELVVQASRTKTNGAEQQESKNIPKGIFNSALLVATICLFIACLIILYEDIDVGNHGGNERKTYGGETNKLTDNMECDKLVDVLIKTNDAEQLESKNRLKGIFNSALVVATILVFIAFLISLYKARDNDNHGVNERNTYGGETHKLTDNVEPDKLRNPIIIVKNSLTKEWQDVGRFLGLSHPDIEHIKEQYDNNPKEQNYQMLRKWREQYGKAATVKALEDALRKVGRRDLADDLQTLTYNAKT